MQCVRPNLIKQRYHSEVEHSPTEVKRKTQRPPGRTLHSLRAFQCKLAKVDHALGYSARYWATLYYSLCTLLYYHSVLHTLHTTQYSLYGIGTTLCYYSRCTWGFPMSARSTREYQANMSPSTRFWCACTSCITSARESRSSPVHSRHVRAQAQSRHWVRASTEVASTEHSRASSL